MTRAALLLLAVIVSAIGLAAPVAAQDYNPDKFTTSALTTYLKRHNLPLVGAQVSTGPQGSHKVLLYGFVASDFGVKDAQKEARAFLHDPQAEVISRLVVRPEIGDKPYPSAPAADAGAGGSTGNAPGANASGQGSTGNTASEASGSGQGSAPDEWNRLMENIYREGAKPPPGSSPDSNYAY